MTLLVSQKPFCHPACWTGVELFRRDDWHWQFDRAESSELSALLRSCLSSPIDAVERLPPVHAEWPQISQKMSAIQQVLEHGSGAVLLKGFPLGDLATYSTDSPMWPASAAAFWRLLAAIGTPVSQAADGRKLFPVQDEGLSDNHPQARGPSSRKRLSFHTDRCDVIGFLCVRQAAAGGESQVVSSMAIYNRMLAERPDLLEQLCAAVAYRRHNVDPGNANAFYRQPIFSVTEGYFACSFLRVLIDRAYATQVIGPMSPALHDALNYLESIAEEAGMSAEFIQQPGDIVLLNNFVTLHRRREFVDDPMRKRLLLRLWLSLPNSRPLDPRFVTSYGSTAAGAIRGGMRPVAAES